MHKILILLNSSDSPSPLIFFNYATTSPALSFTNTSLRGVQRKWKFNYSFSLCLVPKNASGKRPDTSPVVSRAASQQRGQLAKGNQALQVPAVALYPSRKKVPVKDLPPFGKILLYASKCMLFLSLPVLLYGEHFITSISQFSVCFFYTRLQCSSSVE